MAIDSLVNMQQMFGSPTPDPVGQSLQAGLGQQRAQISNNIAQDKSDKNQKLAMMLYALGGALKGDEDFVVKTLQFKEMQEGKKKEKEQKEAWEKVKQSALIQSNPNIATLANALTPEQGISLAVEMETREPKKREILEAADGRKRYVDTGELVFEDVEVSGTPQNIISNVDKSVENTVEEVGFVEPFAQMEEAFGLADATQEGFNIVARKLGFEPADVTGQAVRARDNLNLEIKTTLAQDFTGRVNQQLLQQIDELLPKSSLTSEKDAQAKYSLMRDRARNRIQRLEQGIKSGTLSETQIATARDVLYRTKLLEKKIDAAVLSLEPETTDLDPKKTNLDSTVILDTNETQRFKDLYRLG